MLFLYLVCHFLFALYVFLVLKRKKPDVFDLHIICFWIIVFGYHTAEYYYNRTLYEENGLLNSLAICFLYLVGIILAKKHLFKKDLFQWTSRLSPLKTISNKTCLWTVFFLSAFLVTAYFAYGFFFKSSTRINNEIPYFVASFLKLLPPLVMATWAVFVANNDFRFSKYNLFFLLVFFPSFLVIVFFGGRRMLFYFFLLTAFISLERIRYEFRLRHTIILLFIFASLPFLFDTFQSVRRNPRDERLLTETTESGYKNKMEGLRDIVRRNDEYVNTATTLKMRETSIKFLYDIVQTTNKTGEYANGAVLLNAIASAEPKAFFPQKEPVLSSEEVLMRELGMPSTDAGNTYLSEFFADFGYWGILFAILFLGLIPAVLIQINKIFPAPLTTLYCFGSVFLFLAQVEATMNGFLGYIRNLFIFVILDKVIAFFLKKRRVPSSIE